MQLPGHQAEVQIESQEAHMYDTSIEAKRQGCRARELQRTLMDYQVQVQMLRNGKVWLSVWLGHIC